MGQQIIIAIGMIAVFILGMICGIKCERDYQKEKDELNEDNY